MASGNAGALATISRSVAMLKKSFRCAVALVLGWMLMPVLFSPANAQPQALPAIPRNSPTDQRLQSVSDLSDADLRDVYLNKPWLLPSVITDAEWDRIRHIAHAQPEEATVPPAQASPQPEEPAKPPPPGSPKKPRAKTSRSRP